MVGSKHGSYASFSVQLPSSPIRRRVHRRPIAASRRGHCPIPASSTLLAQLSMADPKLASVQARLQSTSLAFQKVESGPSSQRSNSPPIHQSSSIHGLRANHPELAEVIEARQRLDSQSSENELVLKVRFRLPYQPRQRGASKLFDLSAR